jgi:hypothetical protein
MAFSVRFSVLFLENENAITVELLWIFCVRKLWSGGGFCVAILSGSF